MQHLILDIVMNMPIIIYDCAFPLDHTAFYFGSLFSAGVTVGSFGGVSLLIIYFIHCLSFIL